MKLFSTFTVYLLIIANLTSCTYSITMVHTSGSASDVVDETATNTPSTSVSPSVTIPSSLV